MNDLARLLCLTAALHATPAAAQRALYVDPTGAGGAYKTINAAIAAAKKDDQILIRKGTYNEDVSIRSKHVSLLGIGASPADVLIRGTSAGIRINMPAVDGVTRVSRIAIESLNHALVVNGYRGDLVLDHVDARAKSYISGSGHRGIVAITSCRFRADTRNLYSLRLGGLPSVFVESSDFYPGVEFDTCTATLAHSIAAGAKGYLHSPTWAVRGGPGVHCRLSTLHMSGIAGDKVVGGDGVLTGTYRSAGGVGLSSTSSTIVYSGVTIQGGMGVNGRASRYSGSHPRQPATPTPVLAVRPPSKPTKTIARGATTFVDVHATASANSLTWGVIDHGQPFATPWGRSLIDLTMPAITIPLTHDATGKATFRLELDNLFIGFVGKSYVLQTIALDRSNRLALSAPRMGVIGH